LSRADFGMHLTGRVDAVGPVAHKAGTSKGGASYSFYQQVIAMSIGGQMYEVGYRSDKQPSGDLCPHHLDDVVKIKVENPRQFNGKISFDASQS